MTLDEAKKIMLAQDKIEEFARKYMEKQHCISIGFYGPSEGAIFDHTGDFTIYLQYDAADGKISVIGAVAGICPKPGK